MATKKADAKKPPKTPRRPKSDLTLMNLKVSSKDRARLLAHARRFAEGNVSAWLRQAGLNYRPARR